MESLISQLSSIDKASFEDNPSGRLAVVKAARELIQRLEQPHEKVMRMVWTEPMLLIAIKTGIDMGLFSHTSHEPKSSTDLAKATGADALLTSRILRLLGCCGIVEEVDLDTYVDTDLSAALKSPKGIGNGFHHFWDVGIPKLQKLPDFLKKTGYRNADDRDNPPFKSIMSGTVGCENLWSWYQAHPEAHNHFNSFFSSIRIGQPAWPSYYPVSERLLNNFDSTRPLLIDVGGGKGEDLVNLTKALTKQHQDARLVLQDLPEVTTAAAKDGLPSQIQVMPHSFFQPQPAETQGARAYFLHSVLHDWPDKQALAILQQLKAAMIPGYSKILLLESPMPERVADIRPLMAAMDINMMSHFSAMERTEKQWRVLAEGAGLRYVGFWACREHPQGVIELDLP